MKGILLAGGKGSRLYPATSVLSKHLINIFDKPMIYYSLSVFLKSGIKEILIISMERDLQLYEKLLGDGSKYGIDISYAVQDKPRGIAEAFLIGEKFISNDNVCLVLGDNIFFGGNFDDVITEGAKLKTGALVFGYEVTDPERYGVAKFDKNGRVLEIIEKPSEYVSNVAVAGIYFYDNQVLEFAHNISPSERGELEITSINNEYLKKKELYLNMMGQDVRWLDTGTVDSLKEAINSISDYERRTGKQIACLEEIAYKTGNISINSLKRNIAKMPECDYKKYLNRLVTV